jgi:NAD(P)H-hydrate epimerase
VKILTAEQMREIDRLTTERCGIPSLTLMENAGTRVVESLARRYEKLCGRSFLILCGKGSNGGDGFAVARLLRQAGSEVRVLLFAAREQVKGDAAVNLQRWEACGGTTTCVTADSEWAVHREKLGQHEIIVDAMLGTGLQGPVTGLLAQVIADVNRRREGKGVIAVDVPSGLSSDSGACREPFLRVEHTVTFTAPKLCHVLPPACDVVGSLETAHIGTPVELLQGAEGGKTILLDAGEFSGLELRRRRGAHKGDFGHVLLMAGSRGKTGAAILAAQGALRAGAGLVTVATPASVLSVVAAGLPEMMTEPLAETDAATISPEALDYGRLEKILADKSVVGMGPGLSLHPETQEFVRSVVAECALPMILDADALNAFAGRAADLCARKAADLAITPHPGEMARLLRVTAADVQADRLAAARRAAETCNAFVVLKGQKTIVASPDGHAFINPTGNPGMATGGTGDVLLGVLAGLTAQLGVADWARALSLGVYLHGLAGDMASQQYGEHSMLATDLVGQLPAAFRKLMASLYAQE